MVENFPNMGKEILNQVPETQRVPYRLNPRRNISRHILIKLTEIKHKERILKATREKQQMTYKGIPIKVPADFSAQTEGQKNVHDVLKSDEREKPITKSTLLSKGLIQI